MLFITEICNFELKSFAMKQFVINVPEEKQSFFRELMQNLDFTLSETNVVNEPIPEWHKEVVSERIENASEDDYISWDEAKKMIRRDAT